MSMTPTGLVYKLRAMSTLKTSAHRSARTSKAKSTSLVRENKNMCESFHNNPNGTNVILVAVLNHLVRNRLLHITLRGHPQIS